MASSAELTCDRPRELYGGLEVGHVSDGPVEDGPAQRDVAIGRLRILALKAVNGFAIDIVVSGRV